MTEPQRLLDVGDETESALLASARSDSPSKHAVNTTLAALGLGVGVAAGAGTASAATSTGAGPAASLPPATTATTAAGKAGLGVVAKWIAVASIGGLALWGATQLGSTDETQPPDPVAVVPAAAQETPAKAIDAASEATDEANEKAEPAAADDEGEADDNPEASPVAGPAAGDEAAADTSPAPQSGSAAKAKPKAKAGDASQLGDEVAALDSARKAMADDPDKALEAIEKYQDRFEGGVLGQEAEVLRIEALAKAGKLDQAKALGQAFLAKHPSSPLAKRVRSVLSTASSD
jgi:hypothetical protein